MRTHYFAASPAATPARDRSDHPGMLEAMVRKLVLTPERYDGK